MSTKKISVIIVLYFSKHLVPEILMNVREKIKDLGEILLINNSGEDLEDFKSKDTIVIYTKRNLGYGAAINLGVDKSKYEFILILNPDLYIYKFDISLRDIEREIIISGHDPKIPGYSLKFPSLFSSLISILINDLVYNKSIDKLIHFRLIKGNSEELHVDYVSGALVLTNKKTFKKIGGFDSAFFLFYEETDFCKRASNLNIPVLCTYKISYKPKLDKASSINVDRIKIRAGIMSCKRYHTKYDGALETKCIFLLLKSIYCMYILFMFPFSFINRKIKVKRDELMYRMKFFS